MYKHASINLQNRSRGFIMADDADHALLPDIAQLSLEQARAEQDQLRTDLRHIEQEISVTKASGKRRTVRAVGSRKAAICTRLSAINQHIARLRDNDYARRLKRAVSELAPDLADAIFEHARSLKKEPEEQ